MEFALDSKETILIGEIRYFLRIRACDTDNPIVIFLHGGCGSPDRAHVIKYQSPLAKNFTLVAYDQRGAGLAYNKKEAKSLDLTKDIYIDDLHNIIKYLKKRFDKEKVILVGHSFGSVLGIWYAQIYPNDILAYVGVGQCIDYVENEKISYNWALNAAKNANDKKSIKLLKEIGAPLENGLYKLNNQKCLMKQRSVLHKYGGAKFANRKPYWQELLFDDVPTILHEYRLKGFVKYVKGLSYSPNTSLAKTNPNFLITCKELSAPVYLLLGRHDYNCSVALAEQWINNLSAPDKKIIWFENSAHFPQWEEPEKWNTEFLKLFNIFKK